MKNVRRNKVKQHRKIRSLVLRTFGIMLLVYLTLIIITGENGLLRYMKLKSTRDKLVAETVAIKRQTEDIASELRVYKEKPSLYEEHAREYGLTREGELIFKFKNKE